MSQDRLSSDAALRKMRQEYAVSCQNLVVELEQVTVGLSYFDRPSEESDIKEKLQEIIQDLKDNSSSKISIKKAIKELLNSVLGKPQYDFEKLNQRVVKFWQTYVQMYNLYHGAIIYQGRLVRSLTDRTDGMSRIRDFLYALVKAGPRTRLVEAEERLEALKADYLSDTGEEWSDVREEGPIILTKNIVRGCEFSPELTDIVKQLKKEEALRYPFYRRWV